MSVGDISHRVNRNPTVFSRNTYCILEIFLTLRSVVPLSRVFRKSYKVIDNYEKNDGVLSRFSDYTRAEMIKVILQQKHINLHLSRASLTRGLIN